jgi:hypothetical protein
MQYNEVGNMKMVYSSRNTTVYASTMSIGTVFHIGPRLLTAKNVFESLRVIQEDKELLEDLLEESNVLVTQDKMGIDKVGIDKMSFAKVVTGNFTETVKEKRKTVKQQREIKRQETRMKKLDIAIEKELGMRVDDPVEREVSRQLFELPSESFEDMEWDGVFD